MSKNKSISDLITEIQQENESLKGLAKLANDRLIRALDPCYSEPMP